MPDIADTTALICYKLTTPNATSFPPFENSYFCRYAKCAVLCRNTFRTEILRLLRHFDGFSVRHRYDASYFYISPRSMYTYATYRDVSICFIRFSHHEIFFIRHMANTPRLASRAAPSAVVDYIRLIIVTCLTLNRYWFHFTARQHAFTIFTFRYACVIFHYDVYHRLLALSFNKSIFRMRLTSMVDIFAFLLIYAYFSMARVILSRRYWCFRLG